MYVFLYIKFNFRATNNLFNVVKGHLSNRLSNTTHPIVQLDRVQQFILDLDAIKMEMLKNEV